MYFNPRTREGCDTVDDAVSYIMTDISIHAPVKGATPPGYDFTMIPACISIHAPVKGATYWEGMTI